MSGAPRLLILGCQGQLGQELMHAAEPAGFTPLGCDCVGRECRLVDITDAAAVRELVEELRPQIVVNAAALTAVDRCETEPELAHQVNAAGARHAAQAAARAGIPLVHLSTDYVFDGRQAAPYRESDPMNPLSAYGRSKAQGEDWVRQTHLEHVILRTAWAYGLYGGNFVKSMLQLGLERDELTVVVDQVGCPTATADLAAAIFALSRALVAGKRDGFGTFHFCGEGRASWFEFAREIFRQAEPLWSRRPRVKPVSTQEYTSRVVAPGAKVAARPANSVLDCTAIQKTYGIHQTPWRESLARVLPPLVAQLSTAGA
ncbi:MAG: dTDP-4-dehydrorhamnose reductase [Deltaproteobacteria bacterium]|nr:dTDP-4-dehydrorhamnose reductase [Deltaproteobacteria bacterium]